MSEFRTINDINVAVNRAIIPSIYGNQPSVINTIESKIEDAMLRSRDPINVSENEEITVQGQRGVWVNKSEVQNWRGPVPINQYRLNDDPNPEIVTKTLNQPIEYTQDIQVKYLRPPTPPAPGELIIRQESSAVQLPHAPPQIIRQHAPRPATPEPLIIREAPPDIPVTIPRKIVTIKGTTGSDAPPRKVIIEKLPPMPAKPQPVIIERWLPYKEQRRKVIFEKASNSKNTGNVCKCGCKCVCTECKIQMHCTCCAKEQIAQTDRVRNTVIQWSSPQPNIKKDIKYLGVVRADPREYVAKYGNNLKRANELPSYVVELENNNGYKKYVKEQGVPYELEGDVEALKYLDLDREGLGMYRHYLGSNLSSNTERYSSVSNIVPIATRTTTEVHSHGTQPYYTHEHHEHITRY